MYFSPFNFSLVHVLKYTYIMVQEGSFNLYININLGGGLQFLCFMFRGANKMFGVLCSREGLGGEGD